jgi:hypothetical protein
VNKTNWIELTKVPDLVIRGALISRLGEEHIEVYAPDQDVIVNLNSSSPNLSLEGYSALFNGYPVYVDRRDLETAKKVWSDFQVEMYKPTITETDHFQKFYMMSVTSFIFPIVTHVLAFYHLREGLRKGQKYSVVRVFFSFFVMIPSGFLAWIYLSHVWEQLKSLTM